MEVVYITNVRLPTEKAHGLQIMKSCEAFAKNGATVTLVVPRRANHLTDDPFAYYGIKTAFPLRRLFCLDMTGIKIIPQRIAFFLMAISFAKWAAIKAFFMRDRKNTVFYSRDFITLFFLCLLGLRPVAEIHDYRSQKRLWVVAFILRRVRALVVNSDGTRDALVQHYKLPAKIISVPNGVDLDEFAHHISGPKNNKLFFSYIGQLEVAGTEKGVATLVEAASRLSDDIRAKIAIRIVGGPEIRVMQYRERAREFGLTEDEISFTGPVSYKKSIEYYQATDVIVVALDDNQHAQTTSPIKLFYTMAAGKALIAPDIPGLRRFLDDSNAVFFKAGDPADLADKISMLANRPEKIIELGNRLRQEASKYSWTSRAQRIMIAL